MQIVSVGEMHICLSPMLSSSATHEAIQVIDQEGTPVVAVLPLDSYQAFQKLVATQQSDHPFTVTSVSLSEAQQLFRSYQDRLAPRLQESTNVIEILHRRHLAGAILPWDAWYALARGQCAKDMMIRSRAIQMIHKPGTWFFVELMIESEDGSPRTKIPRNFRHLFTFCGKDESTLEGLWYAYSWEATLSQQDLATFLRTRFQPLGRESQFNDYEEYETTIIEGSEGEEYCTFTMRLMVQVPQPIWLRIVPAVERIEPDVLRSITLRSKDDQEIPGKEAR